jgi:bacillithiol biosynthesis cysteine-adding enzyme BshC
VEVGGQDRWFLLDRRWQPSCDLSRATPSTTGSDREALHQALVETYRGWRLPRGKEVENALGRVLAPEATMVVTGQQPGFLGGPLYTLYKALTAIATARRCQADTGRPCVPIFWVASEDHDLEEVRTARMPAGSGEEIEFRYPGQADRRPLSMYPMDAQACEVLEDAKHHLESRADSERVAAWLDLYRERNLASGFAALIASALGDQGLLLLDPATLRPFTRELVGRLITHAPAAMDAIEAGRKQVRGKGVKPFVPRRFPLFLLKGGQRHYLQPVDEGFEAGDGSRYTREALLRLLQSRPETFSSGALLRPLIQEYAIPSLVTIGGPAEVGYFAQLGPLAEVLGVRAPRAALRLTATVFEGRTARFWKELTPERRASARTPEDLAQSEGELASQGAFQDLAVRTRDGLRRVVDESLEGIPTNARHERLLRKVDNIEKEIVRLGAQAIKLGAEARNAELERARKAWNLAFPESQLQERRWSFVYFVARHGVGWIDQLLRDLEKDPLSVDHRWILLGQSAPQQEAKQE